MTTATEPVSRPRKTPPAKTASPVTTAPGSEVENAGAVPNVLVRLNAMTPVLREKCLEIEALFRGTRKEDALVRYRVGQHVHDLKGKQARYGEKAVEQVAEALGLKAKTLYAYATVAAVWTETRFRDLVVQQGAYGMGLPFTIFLELAHVHDPSDRQNWLDICLREATSTKELRRRIKKAYQPKKVVAKVSAEQQAVRLEQQAAKRLLSVRRSNEEALTRFEGKTLTTVIREHLEKAVAHETELLQIVESQVARLRELLNAEPSVE